MQIQILLSKNAVVAIGNRDGKLLCAVEMPSSSWPQALANELVRLGYSCDVTVMNSNTFGQDILQLFDQALHCPAEFGRKYRP